MNPTSLKTFLQSGGKDVQRPFEIVAREFMLNIAHAIGANDRFEQLGEPKNQPPAHVRKIEALSEVFFTANPDLLTDEVIDEIACGEEGERQEKYGNLVGYKELDKALTDYFDSIT